MTRVRELYLRALKESKSTKEPRRREHLSKVVAGAMAWVEAAEIESKTRGEDINQHPELLTAACYRIVANRLIDTALEQVMAGDVWYFPVLKDLAEGLRRLSSKKQLLEVIK